MFHFQGNLCIFFIPSFLLRKETILKFGQAKSYCTLFLFFWTGLKSEIKYKNKENHKRVKDYIIETII